MKIGKRNKVSTNIFSFNWGLIGESGVGKTTVIYNLLEKICPDGYLFAECGKEDGEEAIENINAVKVVDWNSDYDEERNTIGFITMVNDIVENKTSDYPELVTIVYDVYDELVNIAQQEVIRLHNKQHPDRKTNTIRACFGGFMAGEDMANKMILDALWELKQVGVSFVIIGHAKIKDQTDLATGETFSMLTTDMSNRDFNCIKNKLHLLGVAYIDRSIVREKSKKDKSKTVGKITEEVRKIKFRSDDFSMDSKSRFANIIDEIPLDADALYEAMQDAINAELSNNGIDIKKRENEDIKKEKAKVKEVAEAEKIRKEEKAAEESLNEIVEQIQAFFNENKKDLSILRPIADEIKAKGYKNPGEISDIDDAKEILAMCVIED